MLLESLVNRDTPIMVDDRPHTSDPTDLALETATASSHPWEDVFESESHHPTINRVTSSNPDATSENLTASDDISSRTEARYANDVVSDYERLRSTHATAGYRDGISVGKAVSVQKGFDEGFALGGEIGRAVGYLLGCFQGIEAALAGDEEMRSASNAIKDDLRLERIFAREYISEEGLWTYMVEGEEDGEVTFEQVAWAHPLVVKWRARLDLIAEERGVNIGALKSRMGDAEEEEIEDFATEIR